MMCLLLKFKAFVALLVSSLKLLDFISVIIGPHIGGGSFWFTEDWLSLIPLSYKKFVEDIDWDWLTDVL